MNIAFFISDHGFGHIMRNIPVIRELLLMGHNVVLVCGDKHIEIAKDYFGAERGISFVPKHTDAGLIVKPGELTLDKEATACEVEAYLAEFPERIDWAKDVFEQYHIDKVVVDIVPWALIAAKEAGVPSYLMASFTWIEQYQGYVKPECVEALSNAFRSADHVLYYELVNEPTMKLFLEKSTEENESDIDTKVEAGELSAGASRTYEQVGFVARAFTSDVDRIKSEHKRKIVYLSLGGSNSGLDFDIDVSDLPYDFITTSALRLVGDNVTYLDMSVPNSQDYVKAADYCIAKAGWSTVSEMMLSGNRFAVINRPDVPEDTMIIRQLMDRNAAIGIDVEEFKDMAAVMNRLESYDWNPLDYSNGAMNVAQIIVS